MRGRANEQAAREREEQKRFQLASAERRSRWRPPRDQYEAVLNEHDAPRGPPTRADEHNTFDVIAKRVVASGLPPSPSRSPATGREPVRRHEHLKLPARFE